MQATTGTPLSDEADSAPGHAAAWSHRIVGLWAVVAVVAYLVDQVTKWWAEHSLTVGRPRPVLGDLLRFDLTHNAGAAFSLGTGYTVVLTAVALGVIVGCLRLARRLASAGWAVALGLLLGGALGNVTDRLLRSPGPLRGQVVDFLRLPHWPVFNVADACICVAAVTMVVLASLGVRYDGSLDPIGRPPRSDVGAHRDPS
jgi:signal peptidase II